MLGSKKKAEVSPVVQVSKGAGNAPIEVAWQEGDTVSSVLKRAEVTIDPGQTACIGRRRVTRPDKMKVRAGSVITVAGKPSNG